MLDLDFERRFLSVLQAVGAKQLEKSDDEEPTEEVESVVEDAHEKKAEEYRPPAHINLFQHPDAHPIALDLALLRKYGPEWLEWEGETVELRIPQDFRTTSVSELNLSKIMAVKTLHVSPSYWQQWEVFNWCTAALNATFPDFEVLQVPTYGQCMVSVDIANRVRTDVRWSDEIRHFIEVVARHDGIFEMIEPLDFVPLDAGNTLVDTKEVMEMWPSVRSSGRAPSSETIVGEQLRRLLIVYDYMEESREALRRQLPQVLNA